MCEVHADVPTATLTVFGEIDYATAPQLSSLGTWLLARGGHRDLTVSLREVTFADSAVVGVLDDLNAAAQAATRHVRLVDVPPRVARVLQLVASSS